MYTWQTPQVNQKKFKKRHSKQHQHVWISIEEVYLVYAGKKPITYRAFFLHKTMYLLSYARFDWKQGCPMAGTLGTEHKLVRASAELIMCTFTNYFCNQKCSKEDMTIFPSCVVVKLNYQMAESKCDLFESVTAEVT